MNATHTLPERPPRQGGLVGPALIVGAGVIFLLNNLGLLRWEVWGSLLTLWPLLLIAIGLDLMIGRRSLLGSLLVAALLLAALGAAVWWADVWPGAAGGQLTSQAISQPLSGATRAHIDIGMGVGTLRLSAQKEPGDLIAGTVAQGPRDQLQREFSVSGGTASFKLHAIQQGTWVLPLGPRGGERTWDLRLNPETPLDLKISTGAGSAVLDLTGLNLTAVSVSAGVGNTTLTLPRTGVFRVNVSGGVGNTTIVIPAGMAARVTASTGIGPVRVLGAFEQNDKQYISPGYAGAANRADLQISSGVGNVTVTQQP